ncbi:MAG: uridine diphosphate-N-acetylglucosamine-binding protein YvcK [Actinomycetota bacterium]|nr:MAG: uridine diphosphate-N-acetylglucosamine-binding protein YvcK [Actinomycetota bacterium]
MHFPLDREIVVALGGGHGLASSLRALVLAGECPIGVVSVADDGGSSGRLREDFGLQPPGDIRKCLVALAEAESVWTSVFSFRFESGELAGHSLGNLIIAGLNEVTGDFGKAIKLAQDLIGVKGILYPSSNVPITLEALVGNRVVQGQVNIMHTSGIDSVYTNPGNPEVAAEVVDALLAAKKIVVGPGSLYTSVLAVLAIPKISDAISASSAKKVYVVNLKPQDRETSGFNIADHIRALAKHKFVPDVILADTAYMELGDARELCQSMHSQLVICQLADKFGILHDPVLLADAFKEYG